MATILQQTQKDIDKNRYRIRYVPKGYKMLYTNPYRTLHCIGKKEAQNVLQKLTLQEQQDKIDQKLGYLTKKQVIPELTLEMAFKYFKNKVMPVKNYQLSTQAKYLRLFKEMLDPNKGFGQDYKFCNLNYEDLLFKFGNNSRNAQISKIKMLNSVRSSCLKGISLNRLVGKISGPKISHPTVKKASLNALRKSQLKQIMDCRDIPQVTKNIIKLYILTGCRRSELCGPYFTWKHIDQEQNIAYIYRKNHKDKHSKPFSIPWLKEHMNLVNEISDYFKEYLDCPGAGKYPIPVSSQTLYNYIVKARKAVGFHFTLHDLRDTGATQVLRATGNIYAAKEFCGHRSVKDTEAHYADWIDDDKIKTTKTLVNTLNEVF
jgi:integrase